MAEYLNGFKRSLVLTLCFFCVSAGWADSITENTADSNDKTEANWFSSDCELKGSVKNLWGDVQTLPEEIYGGMGRIYLREDNFLTLLLAGGGSIALHSSGADDKIAENFEDKMILSDFSDKALDFVGGPGQHFAFGGLWYLLSDMNCDELNKQRAWTMIKALSYTGFTTYSLKLIRHDHTPNDKSLAWPSGHTSSSFCVASVLDEYYGPKVGIPAYMTAGLVGYRMMESGDHWASDVLFGAVLGYITGHSVAGEDKVKWQICGFEILPYMARSELANGSSMGVSFYKEF